MLGRARYFGIKFTYSIQSMKLFVPFVGKFSSGATAPTGVPAEGELSSSNSQSNRLAKVGFVALMACGVLLLSGLGVAQAQDLSASAKAQIASLEQEKANRTPAQKKISSQLVFAVKESRNQLIARGVPKLSTGISRVAGGGVIVDIRATVTPELLATIEQSGGTVVSSFPEYDSIRATLPLPAIETIAARPEVQWISPPDVARIKSPGGAKPARTLLAQNMDDGAVTREALGQQIQKAASQGAVVSEGDAAHGANIARTKYNVDGTGIKIGIISDSVESLGALQASGELPQVTVLTGQAGSGASEGTAMLEIVHDLAPGAQLFFASVGNSPATMAQNILALRKAGCDIIIDDIGFDMDDSPFAFGVIEKAVKQVAEDGALYFSASGNTGNKDDGTSSTYRSQFRSGGSTAGLFPTQGQLHDFGGGVTSDTVTGDIGGGTTSALLFWTDPPRNSTNDYDLFLLDNAGTTVIGASTNPQTGTQAPYEAINGVTVGQRVVIVKATGSQDRFFHLDVGGSGGTQLAISTEGSVRGHAAADTPNAFSVSATNAKVSAPGLFTGGATNPVETFTDDGPRVVYFDSNGAPVGPRTLQKPDITAADGVKTATPGFAPFFGTSAAAPHAGAIAALVMSYNRKLSPAQIRGFLQNTALDINGRGVDRDSGYGIIMANRALDAASRPSAIGVSISPAGPYTYDTLTATPVTAAPNGAVYSYQWSVNAKPIVGATKKTFDLSVPGQGDKGQVVSVTITATTGVDKGSQATNRVTVLNRVPIVANATMTGKGGDEIVVPIVAADSDKDALTFKSVGGPSNGTGKFMMLDGKPVFVYRSRRDFVGLEEIRFVATDTSRQTSNIGKISITVQDSVQKISLGVQLMPFSPMTDGTLTATPIIRDITGVTLTYQWYVNDTLLPDESGKQLSLAKPGNGDPEDQIRVVLTATRGNDRGTATNNVKVFNNPPATSSVSGTATSGQSVSFTLSGTDADGETVTFRTIGQPMGGNATIVNNADNTATLTYTSRADFTGTEVIQFVATDPHGRTSPLTTATITVTSGSATPINKSAPSGGGS